MSDYLHNHNLKMSEIIRAALNQGAEDISDTDEPLPVYHPLPVRKVPTAGDSLENPIVIEAETTVQIVGQPAATSAAPAAPAAADDDDAWLFIPVAEMPTQEELERAFDTQAAALVDSYSNKIAAQDAVREAILAAKRKARKHKAKKFAYQARTRFLNGVQDRGFKIWTPEYIRKRHQHFKRSKINKRKYHSFF